MQVGLIADAKFVFQTNIKQLIAYWVSRARRFGVMPRGRRLTAISWSASY